MRIEGNKTWRDGRAAYGACLENRCGETHRGFESLSLRLKALSHQLSAASLKRLAAAESELLKADRLKWGGARVADWARLLSECWGITQPRVRIPPSPLDVKSLT